MPFNLARSLLGFRFDQYEANLFCDLFSKNRLSSSSIITPIGNAARHILNLVIDYTLQTAPMLLAETRSQCLQELFAFTFLKGNITSYFEAGANNGIELSNTYAIMSTHRANGILVEANPSLYQDLCKNRPRDATFNLALSSHSGLLLEFNPCEGQTLYGSLVVDKKWVRFHPPQQIVQVQSSTIHNILDSISMEKVHYLSLDIEGGELDVLQSLVKPFFDVGFIEVNTRLARKACQDELERIGYKCYKYPFAKNEILAVNHKADLNSDLLETMDNLFSL